MNGDGRPDFIRFNATGQTISLTKEGQTLFFKFDDEIGQFVVENTIPGQGVVKKEYDPATGRLLWSQDPSGVYTVYSYDDLGRNTKKSTRSW